MSELRSPVIAGIAVATREGRQAVAEQTRIEQDWYAGHRRFATNQDVLRAAAAGELVKVTPSMNYAPIGRLRNPELHGIFPPFLLPGARQALETIGRMWRSQLTIQGINQAATRLSVTSMARSEETQAALVADPTKLASPHSTHPTGGAFDIDASGYYLQDYVHGLIPVADPSRDPTKVRAIAVTLKTGIHDTYVTPYVEDLDYDKRYTDALVTVTDHLHELGAINRIVEFADTENRCIHVAAQPGFDWNQA